MKVVHYFFLLMTLLLLYGCDSEKHVVDENTRRIEQIDIPNEGTDDASSDIAWDWQLETELSHNYYFGETDDVVFVLSHDGGVSGYHFRKSLYAVEKTSGENMWSVDTGYEDLYFLLTDDHTGATILTKDSEVHLRHVDASDGSVIWSDYLEFPGEHPGSVGLVSSGQSVITFNMLMDGHISLMEARDIQSGEVKWRKSVTEPYQILNSHVEDAYILLSRADQIVALHPDTGEQVWTVEVPDRKAGSPRILVLGTHDEQVEERWLFVGGAGLFVELETGAVKYRHAGQPEDLAMFSVDGRHFLTYHAHDRHTVLYDTFEQRELWRYPGTMIEPTLDGDTLLALIDGTPSAINWSDGSLLWQMDLAPRPGEVELSFAGSFNMLDEYLVALPYGQELWIIDKATGDIVYRMDDFAFDYPVPLDAYSRDRLVVMSGDRLYIGSSNGLFSSISIESFLGEVYQE